MQQQQKAPGILCSICGNLIPVSIQQLRYSGTVQYPTCGLSLSMDKKKAAKALEILAKVDEAQRRAEEASHFAH